jgi:outer membrane protein assembly factor BamB
MRIESSVWILVFLATAAVIRAEDWPEFRGKGRLGVWNETGVLQKFPQEGLKILWRTPVGMGYAGPSVANGRVFLVDFKERKRLQGIERAIALDEKTGKILWTQEWPVNYGGISYAFGPRATPTVDGDRVYFAGADGKLLALRAATGEILWRKDYVADFGARPMTWAWNWGFSSSPIVHDNLLIALVGGNPDAKVVAFDKMTGKEVWRSISGEGDLGVAQPIIVDVGRARQLIVWDPEAVYSLNPKTGAVYWKEPFKSDGSVTVATPVLDGTNLLFSTFYNGPLMLALDERKPAATVLWKGTSENEVQTDKLHALTATPVIIGEHIYGICSYGQFRCLLRKSGERVWESQQLVKERARWASGQIVRNGDLLYINNDRGNLVIVKPQPDGYHEISRTPLIKPTTNPNNRRELVNVNWSHPAYANRHIYARNDEEIIAASLAVDGR